MFSATDIVNKNLRKKEAIRISLPPSIIFSEPSLIEMSNMYPITIEEIVQAQRDMKVRLNKNR